MSDCLETLHCTMRNPDDLRRVQHDLMHAWACALAVPEKAPQQSPAVRHEPLRVHELPGWNSHRPEVCRVILTTKRDWS